MKHPFLYSIFMVVACGVSPRTHDASFAMQSRKPDATAEASRTPSVPTTEQVALTLVKAMEDLGKLHRDHLSDCPAMATALDTFASKHRELLAQQSLEVHAWIDANEPLRIRLRTAMGEVMTGAMRCREDPAVQAFYAKLGT